MRKKFIPTLLISTIVFTIGCDNGVSFSNMGSEGQASFEIPIVTPPVAEPTPIDTPNTPPPVTTEPSTPVTEDPPILPSLMFKSGTCSIETNESVLSCLNCQSEAEIPPPPILSRKAQELWDIMTVACSVPNKSDPYGYVPPTREQLLKRLIQCSPTAYPDTAFESTQRSTIQRLLSNTSAQQSAFSGLYYNWASTDFETYFGLEIGEARYAFCRGQVSLNPGGVYPVEYYDAFYNGTSYTLPPIWQRAQKIRENLRRCMQESLRNPNVNQGSPIPGKSCRYESAEGPMSSLVIQKAQEWLAEGHKVYFEGFNMCGEIEMPENLIDHNGPIKLAIKVCN